MSDDPREELRALARDTRALLLGAPAAAARAEPVEARTGKEALLEPVRAKALACTLCRLCKGRHSVVFGEGSLDAEIAFVGEGPGRDEDQQGRPFVGAAGQLLDKIIQAMKFRREQVYICNAVKCRPPQNRPPEPDELAACKPYLEAQLTTIRPKLIVALGRTAVSTLLQTTASMSALRGRQFEWNGIPLIVTYHPAYLLRNPPAKKEVWEDMKQALALIGRCAEARGGASASAGRSP